MSAKLQMALSMALFGTLSLFVRNIPLTSEEVALFRACIALIGLLAIKGVRRQKVTLKGMGPDVPLLFLSGAAMGFNWIFLFEAYKYTTVSAATLAYYFAPVIVMLACPVLFHEKLTRKQVVCFVGATAGLILVIGVGGFSAGGTHLKGIAFGLSAAALYATVILMNKKISRVSGIDRTFWQFAAAVAVLLPYVLATNGIHLESMDPKGWACLLTVGMVHSCFSYVLYFSALGALPGQESAILSYIDPLVAVLISLCVLGEPVTAASLAGGAMILAFTLANEIN